MNVAGMKFAFLLEGRETNSKEFVKAHFRELSPAKAGSCLRDMKYQVWDAYCQHGDKIEKDSRITKIALDESYAEKFQFLNYTGAYILELDRPRFIVYFVLIPSNFSSIFAFYDVE